jgi:hypothetical protein
VWGDNAMTANHVVAFILIMMLTMYLVYNAFRLYDDYNAKNTENNKQTKIVYHTSIETNYMLRNQDRCYSLLTKITTTDCTEEEHNERIAETIASIKENTSQIMLKHSTETIRLTFNNGFYTFTKSDLLSIECRVRATRKKHEYA